MLDGYLIFVNNSRVLSFFLIFKILNSWIVETTGSEYFQKPIFNFFDNYEYSGLAFKFERAPMCPSRAAKRLLQNLPFTLNSLQKFFCPSRKHNKISMS